jgi:hypothetical protein
MTTGKRAKTGEAERQIADRDQFHFIESILEKMPATEQDCFDVLRPILDQLANTAGFISAQDLEH